MLQPSGAELRKALCKPFVATQSKSVCAGFCPARFQFRVAGCGLHRPRSSTLALFPASLCKALATRNPQPATEVTSVASCGLRLHVASDTHSASPLSLRCAGCGCALRAPCTKDSWHPLRLACCNCTLCLARPAVPDLGCAMRRAVAPCTGLSQSSTPSCTGCGLRVAGCGLRWSCPT